MLVYNKHLLLILFLRTRVGLHPIIRPTSPRWDFSASCFYRIRDLAECPTPVTLVGLRFSLGVFSPSLWPQLQRQELAFCPCMT